MYLAFPILACRINLCFNLDINSQFAIGKYFDPNFGCLEFWQFYSFFDNYLLVVDGGRQFTAFDSDSNKKRTEHKGRIELSL